MLRPIKIWLPFTLAAIALHGLVGAWAFSNETRMEPAEEELPVFALRLFTSPEVRADPREALEMFEQTISCSWAPDGSSGHCEFSNSDEMDERDRLFSEIAEDADATPWAGEYFRGARHESGELLTLGSCGGVWTRACSLESGVGAGRSGFFDQRANGVLEVHALRNRSAGVSYRAVHWGPRRYLIETERFEEFLGAARAGSEPRSSIYGNFFLRDGDEKLPAEGMPTITGLRR